MGELFFDYDEVTDTLSHAFGKSLRDIQRDSNHPLRGKLDDQLMAFARKLRKGDPEACAMLANLQQRMIEHAELTPFLSRFLSRFQGTLTQQLADPDAHLSRLLDELLENLLDQLRKEPDTQARLDAWVRRQILNIAQRNHGVIGDMVKSSLAKLSNADLVAQIEEKVGDDLQFIRVNGAVVGAIVGMAIAGLKVMMGRF